MSTISFPQLDGEMQIEQLIDRLELFRKDFNFLMSGNLSSQNAREFGGYQITMDAIRSKTKDVGMSSARTSPKNVRFWAGSVDMSNAPFRVYDTGQLVATNADITGKITAGSGQIGGWFIDNEGLFGPGAITGGTIRTGLDDMDRIEMSGGKFSGYTSSNQKTGLYFDINTVPGTGIADIHLYHNDSQLLTFYDNISNFAIRPGANASSMIIGASGKTVFANGSWSFSGGTTGTVYVSSAPGAPANMAISFTSGLRTG